MAIFSRITARRLKLAPPDHAERRGPNVLVVWADAPHWMVVDRELDAFLCGLDGERTLDEAIDATPGARKDCSAIISAARDLVKAGVLIDGASRAPRRAPKPRIENVAINLTHRCNLRCAFCYYIDSLVTRATGELSADEFNRFLDEVKPFASKDATLIILGGEPLLEAEKLLAVAKHARRRGLTPLISTNGTTVTRDLARRMTDARIDVQVSLDGHAAEMHDAVRGKGTFDRTVAGVRTLVEAGAHTIVSMVCHRGNLAHLEAFYELALSSGVDEARFIPLKRMGGADASGFEPVPMHEMMKRAVAMFTKHPEYLQLAGRDAFSIMATTCRFSARRTSCGTGLQTVLLDADGALYPCLNMNRPEYRIGNIRDDRYNFNELWECSPVLATVRRASAADNPERACSKCPVRTWCLGGCRGETLAVTGDLSAPSPWCRDLRRTVLDMMWTLAESPQLVRRSTFTC